MYKKCLLQERVGYVLTHTQAHTHIYTRSACLFRYILPDFASKPVVGMWLSLNLCDKEGQKKKKTLKLPCKPIWFCETLRINMTV